MKEIKILELFGGIGACSKALKKLGIDYKIVDYVEIDKYAVKSFNAIHGTNFEPQDICKWDKDVEVDLIMHGSPCQDFSLAGKQAGGDKDSGTRSSLMYETIRIVEKLKPKYVIWENVKNLLSKKHRHNFDAYLETMEQLGYTNYYQVLNAKDYGIPQNRERVFTISILGNGKYEFPSKQDEENLQDFLEKDTNIKTKPMCEKAFNIEYEQIITSDKDIYQCNVSSGYQDCKVGIKVSPTIRANNNCTHVLQKFEFPPKEELKTTMHNLLEENVEEKYYLSEKMTKYVTEKNEKSNFKVFRPHYAGEEKIAHTIQTSGGNRADDNFIVFHFPQKQELKLKLKDMLEDEVDEKYYLSDKMIKYISATGTANFRNPDSKINLDIARPLTTDQNKRAGTTNYLSEDLPSNYNLNEVVRKYGIFDTEKSTHQAGSVYDENGLSPTLDTMQGGYRQPCIEIKETTKQGYRTAYEGDGANTSSMMKYQRENVQEQTIQTITTSGGSDRGVVVDKLPGAYGRDFGSKGKIQNKEYCDTLTASMGTGGGNVPIIKDYGLYGNKQAGSVYNKNGLCPTITTEASQNWNILLNDNPKIRKLTPKECWRLMGFDDADFEKAEKVNSNTQLYKQAGNSIVVNVLEAIFNNLLIDYKQDVKK